MSGFPHFLAYTVRNLKKVLGAMGFELRALLLLGSSPAFLKLFFR
jgi:hypothetical protein